MGLINNEGFYRGVIVDGGLGQTRNGFPQMIVSLKATEVYDPDGDEFLPVDEDHDEIMGYLVLIDSKDRETKTSQQFKKIAGWDGVSFVDLLEMDLTDTPISWRVAENTYEGNTTLQVAWVDVFDAAPIRAVQKITKEDAQALQARYASVLATTKAPAKPVSAKSKKAETKASKPAASKPKPPKATKPKGKCSADEAYNECYSLKRDDVTDDQLNEIWKAEVDKIDPTEASITDEQWFEIKTAVLKQVSKV